MNPPSRHHRHEGFSLVELLVATTLLILLLVCVTQIMNSTVAVSTSSRKRLLSDAQARVVFDRMARDLSGIMLRNDLDVICKGCPTTSGNATMSGGNDAIIFFGRSPAFFDSAPLAGSARSDMALLGYRINKNASSPNFGQLERLGKGLTWDGEPTSTGATNGIAFRTNATGISDLSGAPGHLSSYVGSDGTSSIGTFAANFSDSTDSNYHLLGDGVFRLEYCYLLLPYTDTNGNAHAATYSNVPYQAALGHTCVNGWKDVAAIVVTIAILDKESRKMLATSPSTGTIAPTTLAQMQNALQDTGTSPALQTWQDEVSSSRFAADSGNIPKQAAAQVRIYQRCFYLNK